MTIIKKFIKKEEVTDKVAEELAEWFLWRIYQDLNFPKENKPIKKPENDPRKNKI